VWHRDDPSIVKVNAYSLFVQPVAGARPVVSSMHTIVGRLERGLDEK
jgi:hypothetical protein